jgi:hypothetical protein
LTSPASVALPVATADTSTQDHFKQASPLNMTRWATLREGLSLIFTLFTYSFYYYLCSYLYCFLLSPTTQVPPFFSYFQFLSVNYSLYRSI